MSPALKCSIMLVTFFAGLATGFPLGLILAAVGVIFGFIFIGPHITPMFMSRIWQILDDWTFVAVPMFILMGNFLETSGIAEGLFKSFSYLLGPLRGGLALAVLVVATIFAACTGMIAASVTMMALLAVPIMLKSGYSKDLTFGTVMAGGCLGILIPPSIMLVVMGPTGGLSVGRLLLGAIGPGLLLSLCYIIYTVILCQIRPSEGPPMPAEERAKMPVPERIKGALVNMVPPLFLVLAVLGSIFMGVATPTEAAGVGAFAALLLIIAYRKFSMKVLRDAVTNSANFLGMALIVAVGAGFFACTFIGIDGDEVVRDLVMIGGNKWIAFVIMNLIVFILGFFMSWMGIIFITFPLFIPLAQKIGFDPHWFAIMMAVNMQTSLLTPPFAYAVFYVKALLPQIAPGSSLMDLYRSVVPWVIIIFVVMGLCVAFPDIVMWLPRMGVK